MRTRTLLTVGLSIELVSVVTTLVSGWVMYSTAAEQHVAQFEREVDRGMAAATARLDSYEQALLATGGLFAASDNVDRGEWRAFVESLDIEENYPSALGFGFVRRVPETEIGSFVELARRTDAPDFEISLVGEPAPGDRFIIDYIEPIGPNRAARGLDIGSNPDRRRTALSAAESGQIAVTKMITLVQDEEKKAGFLMLAPLYANGTDPTSPEERLESLVGWTYTPFVGRAVLDGIDQIAGTGVCVSAYDGELKSGSELLVGAAARSDGMTCERTLELGGQNWVFKWGTTSAHVSAGPGVLRSLCIVLMGLFTSTGLLIVMLLSRRDSERLLEIANGALAAKSEFLAVMSHEVRTPLNGVVGMAEMLLEEDLSQSARDKAQVVHASGCGLMTLVNDILDYSKIEEGQLELETVPFDPKAEVVHSVALFRETLKAKDVALDLDLPEEDRSYLGDGLRLRQIVLNLFSNAVKFTQAGTVLVKLTFESSGIRIVVADSGIGMNEQALEHLFEPFRQAESSTSRRFGGTGLGMSIVKTLLDLFKGTIDVRSEPGVGTTFELFVPLGVIAAPAETASTTADRVSPLGLHVLVAEDNPTNAKVAELMLTKLGCTHEFVTDGLQAIDAATESRYDVILMDCQMPELDGFEATRRLRKLGYKGPIFALTANDSDAEKVESSAAGMEGFLTKPTSLKALRGALSSLSSLNHQAA